MYAYKDFEKGKSPFREVSGQTEHFPKTNKSHFPQFTIQQAKDNRNAPQEKIAGHDDMLSDNTETGVEDGSCFGISGVHVRFGSSDPGRLNPHAYTKSSTGRVSKHKAPFSHETFHPVQQMRSGRKHAKHSPFPDQPKKNTTVTKSADTSLPPFCPSQVPTIVFETMTSDINQIQSIYQQTTDYRGNTICLVGFNKKKINDEDTKNFEAPKFEYDINQKYFSKSGGNSQPVHLLKLFSFVWDPPSQVKEGAQYQMPFAEARHEVMMQAQNLKQSLIDNGSDNKDDYSSRFVYRWIDGDAMDDTSDKLSDETLRKLADGGLPVLSGSYGWRSSATSCENYIALIDEINKFEGDLRREFFESHGALEYQKEKGCRNNTPPLLGKGGCLNGYYLPETTLMFSEPYHQTVIKRMLEEMQKKDSKELWQGQEQSKESMRMLSQAQIPPTDIYYSCELTATKPLKNEFNTNEDANPKSYIGKEFIEDLMKEDPMTKDQFRKHLENTRQSVLAMFDISDNTVNDYFTPLYTSYASKHKLIRDELRAMFENKQKEQYMGGRNKRGG